MGAPLSSFPSGNGVDPIPELRPVFSLPDARDLILEAALASFAEQGFHGASMRDIAARAGVSQSLLHHHFGTKETLWNFVGGRIAEDFFSYMAGAIAAEVPVEESIPRVLRSYMMYWQEHPAAFRFNLWRLLDGPTDERQKRSKAISERSVPVFQRAQRSGFVRKDMPAGLTMIVAGSLVQFWLHSQIEMRDALAITGHESMGDEAFLQHVLGLILTEPSSKETSQRNGKGHRIKGKRGKGS